MAIAQVGATSHYDGVNRTNHTVSYAATGGTNTGMIFFTFSNSGSGDVVTAVKYNSVSATKVRAYNITGTQWMNSWRLENTASGTNNIEVLTSVSTDTEVHCIEYTGVDQTNMADASAANTATGNLTSSVTTVTDNCWLASTGRNASAGPMTTGTGTTQRNAGAIFRSGDSNGAKTPAGSHSMGWTAAGSASYSNIVAIKPYVAAAATNDALFFAGN